VQSGTGLLPVSKHMVALELIAEVVVLVGKATPTDGAGEAADSDSPVGGGGRRM
jgi:hypothetical protein